MMNCFSSLLNADLICAVNLPENWLQMIIWYSILLVCLIIFGISMKRKRNARSSDELKDKISFLESFKANIESEKQMSRKNLYTVIFQLTLVRDYCKQTFESSQFTVYAEAGTCLDSVLVELKDVHIKNWKTEKTVKLRDKISIETEKAINFLNEAL